MDHIVGLSKSPAQTSEVHAKAAADKASKKRLKDIKAAPRGHFPSGVMAGDAEPQDQPPGRCRAVLWTRYTGGKELRVRVLETSPRPGRRPPGIEHDKVVEVKDGFVHFEARGLEPGVRYAYAFLETVGGSERRSPVGHFRAAIGRDVLKSVAFGGTSCTLQNTERAVMTNRNLQHAASKREKLSFFIHLGDQVYCDSPPSKPARTLDRFRATYRHAFTRPGMKALHEAFGMYTTWDDHELFNGWQGDRDTEGKDDVNAVIHAQGNLKPIMAWGVQSFYDHQPIRKENREPKELWRRFRWGKALEIFILDCRSERDHDNGRYISQKQETALIEFLNEPDGAIFKFILNARPIGYLGKRRPKTFPPKKPVRMPTEDYSWTHPAVVEQREKILVEARKHHGVWFLSGDLHFGCVGWVDPRKPKPGDKRVGEIMMGPGGQWASRPGTDKRKEKKKFIRELNKKKHISFATLKSNYVVIHVNPAKKRENSTLDITFFHKMKRKFKVLHRETRSYTGRVLKEPDKKDDQGQN
jgi:alkaline phosphatase D